MFLMNMRTGWHPPSDSQFRYNVNRMSGPTGWDSSEPDGGRIRSRHTGEVGRTAESLDERRRGWTNDDGHWRCISWEL